MAKHVKTDLRAAVHTNSPERGIRAWRYAALAGNCFFFVEHCLESDTGKWEWRRFFTGDPFECSNLIQIEGSAEARVYGYVRLRPYRGFGYVFGELSEIFVSPAEGEWLLNFNDGTTVRIAKENESIPMSTTVETLRRIFPASPLPKASQ